MNDHAATVVREPMKVLAGIVRAINDNYSKEASRLARGGELTPTERKQLAELKAKQAELDKKLAAVEKKSGENNEKIKRAPRKSKKTHDGSATPNPTLMASWPPCSPLASWPR